MTYQKDVALAAAWFEIEENFVGMVDAVDVAAKAAKQLKKVSAPDQRELMRPTTI